MRFQKSVLAISAAVMPIALTTAPLAAEGISYEARGPIIDLNVSETVTSKPDMASIYVGVQSTGATAQEALRKNTAEMERLMTSLKSFKIADKDIQTSGLNVNEQWDYSGNERRSLGYVANNRLTVKVRDLDRLGEIIDALTGAGATDINGPQFAMSDDGPQTTQARKNALNRMKNQALDYARWAGYKNVRVVWINESIQNNSQPMQPQMMRAEASDASGKAVIAPGEVGTSVYISAKFEMVNE